jgi:small subunit ribosomal protein S9
MRIAWFPTRALQTTLPRPHLRRHNFQCRPSTPFTTCSRTQLIVARDIEFPNEHLGEESKRPGINIHARLIPVSPSYFTGSPQFIDNLIYLQALLRKYETLPVVEPSEAPRTAWRTLAEYRGMIGEDIRAAKYQKIIQVLRRLNLIHQPLMPEEVRKTLEEYKRDINPHLNVPKPIPIDRFGRALGVGRRKSSTARAWVVEGNGEVLVNGKTLTEVFNRVHDRESAIWALKITERVDKYNVWALTGGGGTTGQAEALTLAIAKALLAHEPALKPALRRGKLICFVFFPSYHTPRS